jgi:hypothetical protein
VALAHEVYRPFSSLSSPEEAVSVSGWETVRDELEETKNVSGAGQGH